MSRIARCHGALAIRLGVVWFGVVHVLARYSEGSGGILSQTIF